MVVALLEKATTETRLARASQCTEITFHSERDRRHSVRGEGSLLCLKPNYDDNNDKVNVATTKTQTQYDSYKDGAGNATITIWVK
jgi:hypothetical protein